MADAARSAAGCRCVNRRKLRWASGGGMTA